MRFGQEIQGVLRRAADAALNGLAFGVNSLGLTVKSTSQEIHLDDFAPDNPYAAGGIKYSQFAGGRP